MCGLMVRVAGPCTWISHCASPDHVPGTRRPAVWQSAAAENTIARKAYLTARIFGPSLPAELTFPGHETPSFKRFASTEQIRQRPRTPHTRCRKLSGVMMKIEQYPVNDESGYKPEGIFQDAFESWGHRPQIYVASFGCARFCCGRIYERPRNWLIFRRSRFEGRLIGAGVKCIMPLRSSATLARASRLASVSR